MTSKLLYLAQLVVNANAAFLGFEGVLLGSGLFSSLLFLVRHRARKEVTR
jgi:hypothetical protein